MNSVNNFETHEEEEEEAQLNSSRINKVRQAKNFLSSIYFTSPFVMLGSTKIHHFQKPLLSTTASFTSW